MPIKKKPAKKASAKRSVKKPAKNTRRSAAKREKSIAAPAPLSPEGAANHAPIKERIFTRTQWTVLLVLSFIQFFHIVDFMVLMPLNKKFELFFNITTNQFGWLVSSYTLAAFVSGIAGTFFIDRISRKRSMMLAFIGFIAGNLLCAAAPGFKSFLIARVMTGAFGGLLSGISFAIIGDLIEPAKRGRATGILMMSFSVAAVLGVPLGIWFAHNFFLQLPYYLIALGSGAVLVLAYLRMPTMAHHLFGPRQNVVKQIVAVMSDEKHQRLYLLMTCHFIAGFSIIPYIAGFMQKNNGITDAQLPIIYLAGGIATIVTSPIMGYLTDRLGSVKVYTWLSILTILPFILVTYEFTKNFPLLMLFTTLFFIFVSGRMVPAMALLNNTVNPSLRGTFMSLNGSVQQLAMSMGAIAASFMISAPPGQPMRNYFWVGIFGVVFNIAALLIANTFKTK